MVPIKDEDSLISDSNVAWWNKTVETTFQEVLNEISFSRFLE
jgi:hypothetical protein